MSLNDAPENDAVEVAEDMPSASFYNYSNQLAYMINAVYRPRIEDTVNFRKLVSFMPFMGQILPQIYEMERSGNKKDAAIVFFNYLKEVEEEGKYQSFVQALKRAGYKILASVIENTEEAISNGDEHKQLINIFFDDIVSTIDPDYMSQILQMKEVITSEEGDQIRKTAKHYGSSDAALELLMKIPHRAINWYEVFLEVLLDSNHNNLVEKLDPKYMAQRRGNSLDEPNIIVASESSMLINNEVNSSAEDSYTNSANSTTVEPNRSSNVVMSPNISNPNSANSTTVESNRSSNLVMSPNISNPNSANSTTVESNRSSEVIVSTNTANPVSHTSHFVPVIQTETSTNEFQKETLKDLVELKSLFHLQNKYLQNLLEKMELVVKRVDRLEDKLDSVLASKH